MEDFMNTIELTIPGKAGAISFQAADPELHDLYHFLRGSEYKLYSDGPEWLIDLFGQLEERFAWR